MKRFQGCEEVTGGFLGDQDEAGVHLSEMMKSCSCERKMKRTPEEDVGESEKCEMSHSDVLKAVKVVLCYFKEQGAPTVSILFLG